MGPKLNVCMKPVGQSNAVLRSTKRENHQNGDEKEKNRVEGSGPNHKVFSLQFTLL